MQAEGTIGTKIQKGEMVWPISNWYDVERRWRS